MRIRAGTGNPVSYGKWDGRRESVIRSTALLRMFSFLRNIHVSLLDVMNVSNVYDIRCYQKLCLSHVTPRYGRLLDSHVATALSVYALLCIVFLLYISYF